MPTVRRMALPVLAVSLFLLSAGAISSSTFAHAQGPAQADHKLQPFTLSSPNFRDGGPLPSSSEYGGALAVTEKILRLPSNGKCSRADEQLCSRHE